MTSFRSALAEQQWPTLGNVALVNDLAASLARLLHHEGSAHALVVATEPLSRLVAHLRHDLRRHCVAARDARSATHIHVSMLSKAHERYVHILEACRRVGHRLLF